MSGRPGITAPPHPSALRHALAALVAASFALGVVLSTGVAGAAGAVSGWVWLDLDGDLVDERGTNVLAPFADPSVAGAGVEAGVAGVSVQMMQGGVPVGPAVTTAADGSWNVPTLPDGTYEAVFSAPIGFDFTSPVPAGDHSATSDPTPLPGNPQLARLPIVIAGGDVTTNTTVGLHPFAELAIAYVDVDPGTAGLQGIQTGKPSFDPFGDCPLVPPTPGSDCEANDNWVRTNDLTTFTMSVSATDIDPRAGSLDNVILEQTITPVGGAEIRFEVDPFLGVPAGCQIGAGLNPASSIIDNLDGSFTLVCNLGSYNTGELKFITAGVVANGNSPQGSSFLSDVRAYAAANDATATEPLPQTETFISTAPIFDLTKNNDPSNPYNRLIPYSTLVTRTNPVTGVSELGKRMAYDVSIIAGGDGRGASAITDPFTFSDIIDPNYAPHGATLESCINDPYPVTPPLPLNGSGGPFQVDRTADNGTWTCAYNPATASIDVTITGADTTGTHYPSEGGNGGSLGNLKVAVTGRIVVWYPFSGFYKYMDPTWEQGDPVVTGTVPIVNCVGDFDPSASSDPAVSNYGAGFEPGHGTADGATDPTGNNCRAHNFTISQPGSFWKRYGGNGALLRGLTASHWPCSGSPDIFVVPGQTACDSGDGPVVAGQHFYSEVSARNSTGVGPVVDQWLCEAIDNSSYRLAPIASGSAAGLWSFAQYQGIGGSNLADPVDWLHEYARFTAAAGQNTWQVDHNTGPPNPINGVIPSNISQMQAGGLDCGEGLTAAGDLEWTEDPQGIGWSADEIVMVRVRPRTDAVVGSAEGLLLYPNFEARTTYWGDAGQPQTGQDIPAGATLPNVSNYRRFGAFGTGTYDPTSHAGVNSTRVGFGDRLIYQRVAISIDKTADRSVSATGTDDEQAVFAGDPILWSLGVDVSDITGLGVAENMTIVDVLPRYTFFEPSCTPNPPPGVAGPTIVPGPGLGETTLTWVLGTRPANVAIPPIVVCTSTDPFAPAPATVTNITDVFADNVTEGLDEHHDERSVRLLQVGGLAVYKEVDQPLDFENEDQIWTLQWGNLSDQVTFSPIDAIDVFPWNGDVLGTPSERELYATDRTGTLHLVALLPPPTRTIGLTGAVVAEAGEWYYTSTPSASISADPTDPSNVIPGGSTLWCLPTDFGVGGCLTDVTQANAARWISADNLGPLDAVESVVHLHAGVGGGAVGASANSVGDLYVNRFTAHTQTFPTQPISSNEPTVRVVAFTLGDLLFADVNDSGAYEAAADFTAPAGVEVLLYNSANTLLAQTTTDADGRWFFEDLQQGDYYVRIPATEFAAGGPLDGWLAQSTPVLDPNAADANEIGDHHAVADAAVTGAVRSTGFLTLSATIQPNGAIIGNEPSSDNVNSLGTLVPPLPDEFTNMTLDLGFIPVLNPGVELEKSTNGQNADSPTGPFVTVGSTVTWTYEVTNTGDTALGDVTVTDNQLPLSGANDIVCLGVDGTDDNVIDFLAVGAVVTCTANGPATDGQYDNLGTVDATPVDPTGEAIPFLTAVADVDPSHYVALTTSIDIEKSTNGLDADSTPGPNIAVGDPVQWQYRVENTGSATLVDVAVTDSVIAAAAIVCVGVDGTDDNIIESLAAGVVVFCSASAAATAGQYTNTGTVIGDPVDPDGNSVGGVLGQPTDTDDSHYFGFTSAIDIEKSTQTVDADTPNGPLVGMGDAVEWVYDVTNDGNSTLTSVVVLDDQISNDATIDCGEGTANTITDLAPGETVSCTATGSAAALGAYANTGSASGTPPASTDVDGDPVASDPVVDEDDSNYFVPNPAVELVKYTQALDANMSPGPIIAVGDTVSWTYAVTNTGDTVLTAVTVVDDQLANDAVIDCGEGTNNVIADLAIGETVVCEALGVAVSDAYMNTGTVTGTGPATTDVDGDPVAGDVVDDDDPSHYFGSAPAILLEKTTQTLDADTPTGPLVASGGTIVWTYTVTNSGNSVLDNVVVADDQISNVTIDCGGTVPNRIGTMAIGEVVVCLAVGTATPGQYENVGSVTADGPPTIAPNGDVVPGEEVDAIDPSHYFGSDPALTLAKATNGIDADAAPGPLLVVGESVTWTYQVENTGNVALTNVAVTDDVVAAAQIDCGEGTGNTIADLAVGEIITCTATGVVAPGQYVNTGTATGTPPPTIDEDGNEVSSDPIETTDPSHHLGGDSAIEVEKSTNGSDADTAPGIFVATGDVVSWAYAITNTGDVALLGVSVVDDQIADDTIIDCGLGTDNTIALLLPGDTVTCVATGTAVAGQYANNATADGEPAAPTSTDPGFDPDDPGTWPTDPADYTGTGGTAEDDDPSHYVGTTAALTIEKATNGADADTVANAEIVPAGSATTWTYTVTNTGTSAMLAVTVGDDQITNDATIDCGFGVGNVIPVLVPAASVTCTVTGTAPAGAYANIGSATGQPAGPTDPDASVDPTDPSSWPTDPSDYDPIIDEETGDPVDPIDVDDPSNLYGASPALDIEKSVNGDPTDQATGPAVPTGVPTTWTYDITNTGDVALTSVVVLDDQIANDTSIDCGQGTDNTIALLVPGETVTCTAAALATAGQYTNNGSVSGGPSAPTNAGPDFDPSDPYTWPTDPSDYGPITDPTSGAPMPPVGDADPSFYWGASPAITVEKSTNSQDADFAPGPEITTGDAVEWTYVITNSGDIALTGVSVVDDQIADDTTIDCGQGTDNTIALLLPGASVTCTVTGTAVSGQYANNAVASGAPAFPTDPPAGFDPDDPSTWPTDPAAYDDVGDPVDDGDPSHYFGSAPALLLEKTTQTVDADTPTGPLVATGGTVLWTYTVTNTGNVPLDNVIVADDQISNVTIDCGGIVPNRIGTLGIGEVAICLAVGSATAGQYENLGSVTGDAPPTTAPNGDVVPGEEVDDDDPSHYFGSSPAMTIDKATNGVDAASVPGPLVVVGDSVTWSYEVENTGNVPLTNVAVTDDVVADAQIDCGEGTGNTIADLAVGEIVMCVATGVVTIGQYVNTGTATGTPPPTVDEDGDETPSDPIEETDTSHHVGGDPSVEVEKSTNGIDADVAPGVFLATGDLVSWTYAVTNTGDVALLGVSVVDDQIADDTIIDCGQGTDNTIALLLPGSTVTCVATGTAVAGQYVNNATADGEPGVPTSADPGFDPADPDTWPTDPADYTGTGGSVDDDDASHYVGTTAGLTIEKATNGADADSVADASIVPAGSMTTWTYTVTNTGTSAMLAVTVGDDQIANDATIDCGFGVGNVVPLLLPATAVTCTVTGTAPSDGYTNTGSATGQPGGPTDPDPSVDPADPSTWPTDPSDYGPIVDEETGDPVDPIDVDDPSNLFGATPALDVEKSVNGDPTDEATGPAVPIGAMTTWTYDITNTGNVALTGIVVLDDQIADDTTIDCGQGTDNTIAVLVPGETVSCTASALATAGQYTNTGSAAGDPSAPTDPGPDFDPSDPDTWPTDADAYGAITDPVTGDPMPPAADGDPSFYWGASPAITVEKATNGQDADVAPGPAIGEDGLVEWTYVITNWGDIALTGISVVDDQIADDTTIDCGQGTDNTISLLLPGASVICTATGAAVLGQYENNATAAGTPAYPTDPPAGFDPDDPSTWPNDPSLYENVGDPVEDDDASHYIGSTSALTIEKSTNGGDADTAAESAVVPAGAETVWSYTVTNTGTSALVDVTVADDQIADDSTIDCGLGADNVIPLLLPGGTVTCTAGGGAVSGAYLNTGEASGVPSAPSGDPADPANPFDPEDPSTWPTDPTAYDPILDPETGEPIAPAVDDDPSHLFGAAPIIDIEKSVNGDPTDTATGPAVPIGAVTTWTYDVTNAGNVALTGVVVLDDQISDDTTIDCGQGTFNTIDVLVPGETVTCTALGTATTGQYTNTGSVTGTPATPSDPDPTFNPADPSTWPTDPSAYEPVTDPTTGDPMPPVGDDDESFHWGASPAVDIEKYTDGVDADEAPGVDVAAGQLVTWTYVVTNTGNTPLVGVTVTDDLVASDFIDCGDGTNAVAVLAIGQSVTCQANGLAALGPYANTGLASGEPAFPSDPNSGFDPLDPSTYPTDPSAYGPITHPETGDPLPQVTDEDISYSTGLLPPALNLAKDVDKEFPETGEVVTWTIAISNGGGSATTDLVLTDLLPLGLELVAVPAGAAYDEATRTLTWAVGSLGSGMSTMFTYQTIVTAEAGPLDNVARVLSSNQGSDDPTSAIATASKTVIVATNLQLPFTGSSNVAAQLLVALLALFLGALLVGLSRRRTTVAVAVR